MPLTGNATTPMIAGINSGTYQSQRTERRRPSAVTVAQTVTTTHARAYAEALSALPIAPIRPLLNSDGSERPASAATCTNIIASAVTAHTRDIRSTTR